ncbi:helix-turn-helix domain-containing protein [Hymenobacter cheonanensis]|uniref:helix-turn-helix domain-containing protein n=1 Tax=Hymenobacter sp. CA2-7 TaxID=3063993 RepID=UPI0027139B3E|nr:helix-turn-helix transcriptional regulator [Hymenobacter sp. CA2-7]MDO7886200.1 helix-turn-helix transcriptional regulator [Hymenobacter sp. CA2-7]
MTKTSAAPPPADIVPLASPAGGEITVLTMQEAACGLGQYDRRDVFKCVLVVRGANELHYATRSYAIDRPALVFTNRLVPFAWESIEGAGAQEGFICAFTEPFLQSAMRGVSLKESVLYRVDGNPVYYLSDEQLRYLGELCGRMRRDFASDYAHKDDLLRNQLSLLVHEAARLQPARPYPAVATNAAERVTNLFMSLLEIQFPVTRPYHEPLLKNAQDFADRLAIHVNSLNRAVKEVTGRPTTAQIAERLTSEAKLLLHHTDWSVGDIADRLGFEYATYFHRFFKQHTGTTPLAFRQAT